MSSGARLTVEIVVPPEFQEEVKRDLEGRGGRVQVSRLATVIRGEIPSDALEGYGDELRVLTKGYGTFRADRIPPP